MSEAGKATLEQRLQNVEDRLAIYNLMSAYGPAVDSCSIADNAALWTEDCLYEVGGIADYAGHAGLEEMINGPFHQNVTRNGSGHVLSLPYVEINGDRAIATNYAKLFAHDNGTFSLKRLVVSRWEFQRDGDAWKISKRTNELLDGAPEGKKLLARTSEALV